MMIFQTLLKVKDYKPKDNMFTSQEEMDYLAKELELETCSNDDLCNLRDFCVMFWGEMADSKREKGEDSWGIHNAMMSITAVIDHYKWHRRMEV